MHVCKMLVILHGTTQKVFADLLQNYETGPRHFSLPVFAKPYGTALWLCCLSAEREYSSTTSVLHAGEQTTQFHSGQLLL